MNRVRCISAWLFLSAVFPAGAGAVDLDPLIRAAAARHDVDPVLVKAVVEQESRGRPWVLNISEEPFYLASAEAALRLVRSMRSHPWLVRCGEGNSARRWLVRTKAAVTGLSRKTGKACAIRPVDSRNRIAVGAMQVYWRYHRNNFGTIAELLDPARNIDYGTRYLAELLQRHGFPDGIGYYYGNDPDARARYQGEVLRRYQRLRDASAPTVLASTGDAR